MEYLSLLTTAFGFIGFAGGAVGYFAKGRSDSIIAAQSELLSLRDTKISDLEKENAALKAERDSFREQNANLIKLAQGSPQLINLTKEIKRLVAVITKGQK